MTRPRTPSSSIVRRERVPRHVGALVGLLAGRPRGALPPARARPPRARPRTHRRRAPPDPRASEDDEARSRRGEPHPIALARHASAPRARRARSAATRMTGALGGEGWGTRCAVGRRVGGRGHSAAWRAVRSRKQGRLRDDPGPPWRGGDAPRTGRARPGAILGGPRPCRNGSKTASRLKGGPVTVQSGPTDSLFRA